MPLERGLEADGVGVAAASVRCGGGDDREVVALDHHARAVRRARPTGSSAVQLATRSRRERLLPRRRAASRSGVARLQLLRRRSISSSASSSGAGPSSGQVVGVAPADRLLPHVREERGEAVEVPRQVGIELVVVALGAADGRAQPDRRGVPHAVGEVDRPVLLRLGAALLGGLEQPVVAGRDPVSIVAPGQQVAGELLGREAVEGQVAR